MQIFIFFVFLAHNSVCFWMLRQICDVKSNRTDVFFDCSGRKLTKVPSLTSLNVTRLDLSDNIIRKISNNSFPDLRNLTFLDLRYNRLNECHAIQHQAFSGLVKVRKLLLDGNSLSCVPQYLPHGLELLSLSSNKVKSIGSRTFRKLQNIKAIILNKNCYFPESNTLSIENATFSSLIHLKNLSLTHNRLKNIPPNLPKSLTKLELLLNTISYVRKNDLQDLTHLKILDLSGNCPQCSTAPFPCQYCPTPNGSMEIHPEAFRDLSNLEDLHLSGNSLRKVLLSWFKNLSRLKNLYLSFNFLIKEIETGDFLSVLPHVEVMDLSFNRDEKQYHSRIKLSMNFSKMISLKTLHLEGYVFQKLFGDDLQPLYTLKNLSVLNLATNFMEFASVSIFSNFLNLSLIYLTENKLVFSSAGNRATSLSQCEGENGLYQDEDDEERYGPTIHTDEDNGLYPTTVKQECRNNGQVLDLSKNNIFYIDPRFFKGLENTTCLNLSSNSIEDSFNGTNFIHFPNLKYLDLSHNKIYLDYGNAFSELGKLEILDLSHNKHYFMVTGVSHNLLFLKNLNSLRILNMSWNEISILTHSEMKSSSLQELNFQGNRLDILWKNSKKYFSLFKHLRNLTHLDISFNELRAIPPKVYENFPRTLTHLTLSRNQLKLFRWTGLGTYLPHLKELDLSKNKLNFVPELVVRETRTLQVLKLSYNRIVHLSDGFLMGAERLQTLDLSYNRLFLLNHSTFLSGPDNYLTELSLDGNPLACTCDLLDFVMWIERNAVEIPRLATGVTCATPSKTKGEGLINFDTGACVSDDMAFILYLISSSVIVCSMAAALTVHLFYWDASYIIHYCWAKTKGYRHLGSKENVYGAFITYDTKDPLVSDWVLNRLRAELEESGDKLQPICLEERDWAPGAPVIDNLSQSISHSRKTVFVLTEAYVRSGTFRMAAYLAHQRLLDEDTDVTVLVLLEPVLRLSRFLRLRRQLCEASVLEWPSNPSAEHWFWQRLRNAIRVDNQAVYNKLYSSYFGTK